MRKRERKRKRVREREIGMKDGVKMETIKKELIYNSMITNDDYTYTACLAGVESQEALVAVLSRAYRKKLNASDIRHDYVIAQ